LKPKSSDNIVTFRVTKKELERLNRRIRKTDAQSKSNWIRFSVINCGEYAVERIQADDANAKYEAMNVTLPKNEIRFFIAAHDLKVAVQEKCCNCETIMPKELWERFDNFCPSCKRRIEKRIRIIVAADEKKVLYRFIDSRGELLTERAFYGKRPCRCPDCGRKIESKDAKFCNECGAKLD
jgi:hypothetical protein